MFAVLKVEEREKGFRAWIKERKSPPEVTCRTVKTKEGLPFFIINAPSKKGKIPWNEITYAAGKCVRRMIFPMDIKPPENSIAKLYEPEERLRFYVLFNTVCDIIKRSQIPAEKIKLCIVDKKAMLIHKINQIIPFASEIRIVTDKEDEYDSVAKDILKKYGASLFIGNSMDLINMSNVAMVNNEDLIEYKNELFVFSARKKENSISLSNMKVPKEYEEVRQCNIDEELFVNALYELCRVKIFEDYKLDSFVVNDENIGIDDVIIEMKKRLNS